MWFPFQATSIDTLEITLKISDIQESHFTTYILTARNDIGTAEKQISFQEGEWLSAADDATSRDFFPPFYVVL